MKTTQKVRMTLSGNIITIMGGIILVNGYPAATTYSDFCSWFWDNHLTVSMFANWPFMRGIYNDIVNPKFIAR